MSDAEKEPKIFLEQPVAETHLADGTVHREAILRTSPNVDPEEAREAYANVHGVDTESVDITHHNGEPYDGTPRSRKVGRKSVAFSSSRWRASWDPKADPTQN